MSTSFADALRHFGETSDRLLDAKQDLKSARAAYKAALDALLLAKPDNLQQMLLDLDVAQPE